MQIRKNNTETGTTVTNKKTNTVCVGKICEEVTLMNEL